MTQDEIISMAREAGMRVEDGGWILCGPPSAPEMELPALERFAALVAAAKREQCAKESEAIRDDYAATGSNLQACAADYIACALRALKDGGE